MSTTCTGQEFSSHRSLCIVYLHNRSNSLLSTGHSLEVHRFDKRHSFLSDSLRIQHLQRVLACLYTTFQVRWSRWILKIQLEWYLTKLQLWWTLGCRYFSFTTHYSLQLHHLLIIASSLAYIFHTSSLKFLSPDQIAPPLLKICIQAEVRRTELLRSQQASNCLGLKWIKVGWCKGNQ